LLFPQQTVGMSTEVPGGQHLPTVRAPLAFQDPMGHQALPGVEDHNVARLGRKVAATLQARARGHHGMHAAARELHNKAVVGLHGS